MTTSFSATQRCNVGAMLWPFETAQCRNNVATLCCAKSHRCESSLVTSLESENNSYTVWLVNYTCKSFMKLTLAHVPMVLRAYFVSHTSVPLIYQHY